MNIAWSTTGGKRYALQATAGGPGGSYTTNAFTDISPAILLPGGTPQTNYVDVGGATNSPARYYRTRQLP